MDLKKLEYLNAVYDLKSFTRASEKYYVSQPTITMSIRKLEEELNCQLIKREVKPLTFTPAGEFFMPYVKKILAVVAEGETALKDYTSHIEVPITACVSASMGNGLLPRLYSDFINRNPGYELITIDMTMEQIQERLLDERLDIAYTIMPDNINLEKFVIKLTQQCELCLLVNNDHPLAKEEDISFDMLIGTKVLTFPEGSLILRRLRSELRSANVVLDIQKVFQVTAMETLVKENYGVSTILVNSFNENKKPANCTIKRFNNPIYFHEGILIKRNREPTQGMLAFIDYIFSIL